MKVEFMPGINSISGSLKQKDGNRLVFTHRRSDKSGQGRLYLRHASDYQRSTPVSDEEMAARELFAKRAQEVAQLVREKNISKKQAWQIVKART